MASYYPVPPADGNTPLTKNELRQIRRELRQMDTKQLWNAYGAAYGACNPGVKRMPKVRAIQQMVQIWRELYRRIGGQRR